MVQCFYIVCRRMLLIVALENVKKQTNYKISKKRERKMQIKSMINMNCVSITKIEGERKRSSFSTK